VTLAFEDPGDRPGPAVLLLHAWLESLRSFDRLTPALPASHRVLALDQRGHGEADKPADGYDLDTLADDVVAFLDAMGLASVVLAGSSSGGYVAQQVALRYPRRVAGLVLIGSPRTLQGRPPFADQIDQLADPVDPAWVTQFLTWFPLFHEVPDWYLQDRIREAASIPAAVWQATLAGLTTSPPPTSLGTIRTPSLILWGDRDGLLAHEDQIALAEAIPNSQILVYQGVGHLVLWEQPERVATDITRFLRHAEA
jgi:rifampin ADP-ribosylating transferase